MQVQSNSQLNQSTNLKGNPLSDAAQISSTNSPLQEKAAPLPQSAINHVPLNNQTTADTVFNEQDQKVKLGKSKHLNSKKQIPTILGLLILFVALISGVLLFGQGTGVFAPRATAETTPKNIIISNVTDKSFTVSFYTDESTVAFIKYGTDSQSLNKQASDDRDQMTGVVKDYHLHHITVRSLEPGTNYFYTLGTGSNSFDNDDQPYTITTAAKPSQSPSNSQTLYGNVFLADGSPADGAVVYVYSEGMGVLSGLVKTSGSWGVALANAFKTEKSGYINMTDESAIEIKIQGTDINSLSNLQTTVALAQPTTDIILGKANSASTASASATVSLPAVNKEELLADANASSPADLIEANDSSATPIDLAGPALEGTITNEPAATDTVIPTDSPASASVTTAPVPATQEVLNLNDLSENQAAAETVLTTSQPQIKANLPANTTVRIVVHSETNIDQTVQTDANGDVTLDVASLGENLEPGEHTASYTYTDLVTGEEVTKTYSFTVDPAATRQLATVADLDMANQITPTPTKVLTPTPTSSVPYGSGNPFVPTGTVTGTLTPTAVSTRSAVVATDSSQYSSGSVGTTVALLLGGLFFVLVGTWSYFLATSFESKESK